MTKQPKFAVGQVVAVMGTARYSKPGGSYHRVNVDICRGEKEFIYFGIWKESELRPLTRKEIGPRRAENAKRIFCLPKMVGLLSEARHTIGLGRNAKIRGYAAAAWHIEPCGIWWAWPRALHITGQQSTRAAKGGRGDEREKVNSNRPLRK